MTDRQPTSDECVWTRLSDGVFRIGCCGRTATGRIPDTGPSVCSACHNPVRVADTLTSNLSNEQLDELLFEINDVAREVSVHDYGLPVMHLETMATLRIVVQAWVTRHALETTEQQTKDVGDLLMAITSLRQKAEDAEVLAKHVWDTATAQKADVLRTDDDPLKPPAPADDAEFGTAEWRAENGGPSHGQG